MSLPSGDFFAARNGNSFKWYQTDGQTQTYIPKSNRTLAEKFALKKYLSLKLQELNQQLHAVTISCSKFQVLKNEAEHLLCHPAYKDLLSPFFQPLSEELSDWAASPYEHNQKYPQQLLHSTPSGHVVRSKSESLIAMILYLNQIPFRYECALHLGSTTFYPDFTIRHPKTGETYYWEHFGLMDNQTYCHNTFQKLQHYSSHGIIPTIQLITTYETVHTPLNSNTVESIVKQYFSN